MNATVATNDAAVADFVMTVESTGEEGVALGMRACEMAGELPPESRAEAWGQLWRRHPSLEGVMDFVKPEVMKAFAMPSWQSYAANRQPAYGIMTSSPRPCDLSLTAHIQRIADRVNGAARAYQVAHGGTFAEALKATEAAPAHQVAHGSTLADAPQATEAATRRPAKSLAEYKTELATLQAERKVRVAKAASSPAPAGIVTAPALKPATVTAPSATSTGSTYDGDARLAAARAYQAKNGGTLPSALRVTATPEPADPLVAGCADHLARAEKHRAGHAGCTMTDALRATAAVEPETEKVAEPATVTMDAPGYDGDARLAAARAHQAKHGGTLMEALRATVPAAAVDPLAVGCEQHVERAKSYQAQHAGCTIKHALRASATE